MVKDVFVEVRHFITGVVEGVAAAVYPVVTEVHHRNTELVQEVPRMLLFRNIFII